ncbi:MAG: tripartite tricarboxylate transporter substrate binding protein [Proteobacteria bacterium]|nr:tripartite tricarboxylate transporter substrate binding protein [Pseudomonadota bacterium]
MIMRWILAALLVVASLPAVAAFPEKPIRIIVPTAPGGSSDIVTRLIANAARAFIDQPFVIDNRPGANGNVGMDVVAKAPPDGYTLGNCAIGVCSANRALVPMPFAASDLLPMFWSASVMNMLALNSGVPAQALAEFVQLARTRELSYGSSGVGSAHHLSAELLAGVFGVKFLHVAYRGAGPAIQDLLAGRVDFMIENVATLVEHRKSGQLRGLAVTGATRTPIAPDLPTLRELGYPDVTLVAWFGFATRAGTPLEIVATLNALFNRALQTPVVQARFAEMGLIPEGGPAARFGAHIAAETAKWQAVVTKNNIKPE